MSMNRLQEKKWAQEMMLEAIDNFIKDDAYAYTNGCADEDAALRKQRSRIAKFLRLS